MLIDSLVVILEPDLGFSNRASRHHLDIDLRKNDILGILFQVVRAQ